MTRVEDDKVAAPSRAEAILRASGVCKSFKMGDARIEVLKNVDLAVRAGEFVAIEGRSGSGKSTLLHILGGLDSLDSGTVEFNRFSYAASAEAPESEPWLRFLSRWARRVWVACFFGAILATMGSAVCFIFGFASHEAWSMRWWVFALILACVAGTVFVVWLVLLSVRAIVHHGREVPLTRLRNEEFGFVFQFYHLLPELNVLENTLLTSMIGGSRRGQASREERARKILEQLGMGHRIKHRPAHLSGGERQRVAIARALMNNPKVLFADEPTGNLDAETGKQIMSVFEELHREHGQTVVMVTHDRTLARRADRVLILRDGKIERAADVTHE